MAAEPNFIATSPAHISKFTSAIKEARGRLSESPEKFVVVKGQNEEERKIEMIRERVRQIPGKNILSRELVGALRAHYSLQLAIKSEDVSSTIIEHFRSNFNNYEHASKVKDLADPENFENLLLLDDVQLDPKRDPLNDVFLELTRAAELYCIENRQNAHEKREALNHCEEVLMLAFFGMWARRTKGIEVHSELARGDCISAYRTDVRDNDNWGYWVLPKEQCGEDEFERIRHLCWRLESIVEQYWEDEPYLSLFPYNESIREMETVDVPFVVFQKEEKVYRGGGNSGNG